MKLIENLITNLTVGIIAFALFAGICHNRVSAQCDNVAISLSNTASTCQSNGTITVKLSGSDVANLRTSDMEYSITPKSGDYSRPWAQATDGVLRDIPAGTYTVKVKAFCSTSNDWVVKETSATTTIANEYTVPNVYLGTMRKTLNCKYTGQLLIVVANGRAPYTITMTNYPNTYTGSTEPHTMNAAGTYSGFDALPEGDYTFTIVDACTYSTTLSGTVTKVASDVYTNMIYPYPYMPSSYTTDCKTVRLYNNISAYPTQELNPLLNADNYEIGFSYNGGDITWHPYFSSFITYTLPVDRDQLKIKGNQIEAYVRVIGGTCSALKVRDISYWYDDHDFIYTYVDCNNVLVKHRLYGTYLYNMFCWPYKWRYIIPNGSPTDWSENVATTDAISTTMPYGSTIEYEDAKGTIFSFTIAASPANNIIGGYSASYCISPSAFPNADGDFPSYPYIRMSLNSSFPEGTRVQYISGPVGAPAPNFSDYTTTETMSYIYPYSTNTTPSSMSTPYPHLPIGKYEFDVTLPGCSSAKRITINPSVYNAKKFKYTTDETCEGLRVYPKEGEMSYSFMLSSGSTYTYTYSASSILYSIETAPNGVTVDKTAVKEGESLLLPASGEYVIKMFSSSLSDCAMDTVTISYTKKQLTLDVGYTSAYVCQGVTLGYIGVKGVNGTGNYTYQLYDSSGTPLTSSVTTTTGEAASFDYGTANTTYTVKITDNTCNTSFEQDITVLDLTDAKITYSSQGNNNYCEGQTIELHCLTLGETTYSWTGPNSWTSYGQHPTLANATTAMTGWYKVSVTAEHCGTPNRDSVYVTVNPLPAAPVVPNATLNYCRNVTAPSLLSATGATATQGNTLRWYSSDGTTVITPPSPVSTSTAGSTTYYVSQVNSTTGCESAKVPVTVNIINAQPATKNDIDVSGTTEICYGMNTTLTASLSGITITSPVYLWYSSQTATTPFHTGASYTTSNLTTDSTFYVSVSEGGLCENAVGDRKEVTVILSDPNTQGKDFYVSFGNNYSRPLSGVSMQIRIVAQKTATVNLTYKNNTDINTSFTVPAGSVYTHDLTLAEKTAVYSNATGKTGKSLRIQSTEPVSVYALNQSHQTTDATFVLPVDVLGTDYYLLSYMPCFTSSEPNISDGYTIVAIDDDTDIYENNVPKATLQSGEVYSYYEIADMTGRHITSTKPIACFVTNQLTTVPNNYTQRDHLYEQMTPVNVWGRKYVVPVSKRGIERVRIIASQDGTTITQNGGTIKSVTGGQSSLSLDRGQFVELEITLSGGGCYILANKPVGVASYLMGRNYPGLTISAGDPSLTVVPPVEQMTLSADIAPFIPSISTDLKEHYVMIITPTATRDQTTVSIGGDAPTQLSGGSWTTGAGTGTGDVYSFYTMQLTSAADAYHFANPNRLLAMGFGIGGIESYCYLSGAAVRTLESSFTVDDHHYEDLNGQTICIGSEVTFRASGIDPETGASGYLLWYIDGNVESSQTDELQWTKPLADGQHTVKIEVIDKCRTYSYTTTFNVVHRATPAHITAKDTAVCYKTAATIIPASSGVTSPIYWWYSTQTATTPFHTGASYTTSNLTTDSTFYVSVSGTGYCENATNNRKEITVTVKTIRANADSIFLCVSTEPETRTTTVNVLRNDAPDSDTDVLYLTSAEYVNDTDANLADIGFNATDSTITLTLKACVTLSTAHTFDIIYNINDNGLATSQCVTGTLKVKAYPMPKYPDIRVRTCPNTGNINLAKYIDTVNVIKSIEWKSRIPGLIKSDGRISTNDLPSTGVFTFTYTITDQCVSEQQRKGYIETLKGNKMRPLKDTVSVWYKYAEAMQINQLFGIEANGEWAYCAVASDGTQTEIPDHYVTKSKSPSIYEGAVVMNGKGIYEDTNIPGGKKYHENEKVKMVKFTYTADDKSCLKDKKYEIVIVLTEDI